MADLRFFAPHNAVTRLDTFFEKKFGNVNYFYSGTMFGDATQDRLLHKFTIINILCLTGVSNLKSEISDLKFQLPNPNPQISSIESPHPWFRSQPGDSGTSLPHLRHSPLHVLEAGACFPDHVVQPRPAVCIAEPSSCQIGAPDAVACEARPCLLRQTLGMRRHAAAQTAPAHKLQLPQTILTRPRHGVAVLFPPCVKAPGACTCLACWGLALFAQMRFAVQSGVVGSVRRGLGGAKKTAKSA